MKNATKKKLNNKIKKKEFIKNIFNKLNEKNKKYFDL